jgi:pteridine reductase
VDIHVMGQTLRSFVAYNASKAALLEITMSCAMELAPAITVNAIAPGVVAWADSYNDEQREQYLRRVPLGRAGTPEDAATAVLFLVRDAHYCTGQIIKLDGGRAMT